MGQPVIRVLTQMRLPSSTPAGQLAIRRGTANADGSFPVTVEALAPTSAQIIAGLGNQSANQVFAGPGTGSAAAPGFRSLVAADIPTIAHSALSGLATGDDHTQYALLAGRSGGQTLSLNTASGGAGAIYSTSHATKGSVSINGVLAVSGTGGTGTGPLMTISNPAADGTRVGTVLNYNAGGGRTGVIMTDDGSGFTVGSTGVNITGAKGTFTADLQTLVLYSFGNAPRYGPNILPFLIPINNSTDVGITIKGAASQSATLIQLQGLSSTSTARAMVDFDAVWANSADASRKSRGLFYAWDFTARREAIRFESSGTAAMLGFFGTTAAVQQSAGTTATDAASTQTLANALRTALVNLGLAA